MFHSPIRSLEPSLVVIWALEHSFMLLLVFIAALVISSIKLWFIVVMKQSGGGVIGIERT